MVPLCDPSFFALSDDASVCATARARSGLRAADRSPQRAVLTVPLCCAARGGRAITGTLVRLRPRRASRSLGLRPLWPGGRYVVFQGEDSADASYERSPSCSLGRASPLACGGSAPAHRAALLPPAEGVRRV